MGLDTTLCLWFKKAYFRKFQTYTKVKRLALCTLMYPSNQSGRPCFICASTHCPLTMPSLNYFEGNPRLNAITIHNILALFFKIQFLKNHNHSNIIVVF